MFAENGSTIAWLPVTAAATATATATVPADKQPAVYALTRPSIVSHCHSVRIGMAVTQGHCERGGRGARNGSKGAVRSRSLSLRVLDLAAPTNNDGGNDIDSHSVNANNSNGHARTITNDTQHRERGQTTGGLSMGLARGAGGRALLVLAMLLLLSVVCGTTAQFQQEQ